jgi:pilus assembly protein CpaC
MIMRTIDRHLRIAVLAAALLLTSGLSAQTANVPLPAPPAQNGAAQVGAQVAPPNSPPVTAPPATNAAPVQPSAPLYPHREAKGPASLDASVNSLASLKIPDEGPRTLHVVVGRSLFVNTPDRLRRVFVSNPTVIESMSTSPKEVVVTARAPGSSSLVLWNEQGVSTVLTVLSDMDVSGLRESLAQALPADRVDVEVQGSKLFLTGVVGSDAAADIANRLASVYTREIVNSLIIDPRHRPQVKLKVRFAELDRSKLDSFGINIFALGSKGVGLGTTGQFSPPSFQTSGSNNAVQISDFLNLFYFDYQTGVGTMLKDLQTKGVLEILAEPDLTTIDGQPAKFLAGGEFPFPVVQPGGAGSVSTVTIEFKEYGVKLEFTPFVNPDGTIRLKVKPEVSSLDFSNVVVIAGYTIPSINTRTAETTVELKDNQTFGISGILDRRTTDTFNKMPGISDIPVLGQLFRSKGQNHSVMELVVVVTPSIVDPLNSDEPAPASPNFITPPGQLGNFEKGLPKSYQGNAQAPGQGANH